MKAKTKQRKKMPNIKVIAGVVGAILVIGIVGGNGDSAQSETTTADNMPTIEAGINISDETISMEVVKNTEEDTTSSEALTEAPTIEETTEEITTAETTAAVETTTMETTPPVETTTVEATTQVVLETTTEITTTTEAVTEPPATTAEQTTTVYGGDELVWVSETGEKYHSKNNCYPMNPDKAFQVTKDEAINIRKLEPCGKCYK